MNIVTIFAGRKPNLEILLKYLRVALETRTINEVHLWNYTRNEDDEVYIKHVCDKNNDVIFMDNLNKLPNFIEFIKRNDYNVVFANTINNGVSAYLQQHRYALIPLTLLDLEYPPGGMCGSLWDSGEKATILHNYFVENYYKFLNYKYENEIIQNKTIFSINFFGYKGKNWHKIKECWPDDEHLLTTDYVLNRGFINVLYSDFYVSHLSFYRQIETGIDLNDLRNKYNMLRRFFIDAFYNQF